MKEDLKDFKHSQQQIDSELSNDNVSSESNLESRVNKAESAFERVIENATGVVGRVKSSDANAAVKIAELDALDRSNRIQQRLQAIKHQTEDEK